MSTRWTTPRRRSILALLALAAVVLTLGPPAVADEVLDWNTTALEVAVAGGQSLPIPISRTWAMVHLAIHDALNAIDRRYEPYAHEARAERDAAPEAAIAAAARDVLAGIVPAYGNPTQRARAMEILDKAYATALARLADGPARSHGIGAGQAAAATMLSLRRSDGAAAPAQYTPGTAPGQWRPTPNPVPAHPPLPDPALAAGNLPAILPQWAHVTPFTLLSPSHFRLPAPPPLSSESYARDYDEVRRLGAKNSTARTAQQAETVRYWYEGSPQGWNRIARVVAIQRALDRWEHARLLALVNAAMADGFIAGADTRYVHNLWRPVTAIRAADTDGNATTAPDPTWESYVNTPALPDYPSTHSVLGAAAAAVLARFFGSDQIAFTMTSGAPFAGITRSFTSLSQAARENAESRVLGGVHFRSACQDGLALGERIGRRAYALHLQPYRR
jgi:PAP2 superfamily/Vanadium chloroperoxidase N-terminal domain